MTSDAYEAQAPYYDLAYRDVDYAGDVRFLQDAFARPAHGRVARVLDLGSGTGTHALHLARAGYDVVGVDLAEGLVRVAREKATREAPDVAARLRFERGDMARDVPDGPFDAAVSLFGSFNYLTDDARAAEALRRIHAALRPGGLVLLEFWSPIGFRPQMRWARMPAPDGGEFYYLVGGTFDKAHDLYRLRFEGLHLRDGRVVHRFEEDHALRLRTPATMRALLLDAGYGFVQYARGDVVGKTLDEPAYDAMRVIAIGRRE